MITSSLAPRHAIMLMDAIASMALIVIVVATLAIAMRQYAVVRAEQVVRRELRLAVENELHRLRIGAVPAAETPAVAPPGIEISLETTTTPGDGVWSGFNCVTVTATRKVTARRTAAVELSEYLPVQGGP